MKKFICLIFSALITFSFCACENPSDNGSDELSIVCTAFPQYDYIKNIIGSEENLTLLLDDGGDLHSYEPTAQDIISIGSADLFVYIGGVSDEWVEGALQSANSKTLKTIAIMDLVDTYEEEYVAGMQHEHSHSHNEAHSGDHKNEDEHIWLSLRNSAVITQALCDEICKVDPANAEKYKTNAQNYINKLNSLDKEYESVIESAKRDVLLFADRFPFRYLIEDYNLTYHAAFAGCSSESEASFETMAYLIDKTAELKLPVILTIEGSDGSLAKTVCDETGAKSATLNSCQSVTAQDIENGTSYINIMKSNLEILQEALN